MMDPTEQFLNFLTVEKGLSSNTLEAYRRDIGKFSVFLKKNNKKFVNFKRADILAFIDQMRNDGNQPATIARNIAALRGLCRFMLMEGVIKEDPIENLLTPKGWKRVPRIIGTDEVSSLTQISFLTASSRIV